MLRRGSGAGRDNSIASMPGGNVLRGRAERLCSLPRAGDCVGGAECGDTKLHHTYNDAGRRY